MSEGPIRRERAARGVPRIEQAGSKTVHGFGGPGLGYCGRRTSIMSIAWVEVTCPDCQAARRADEAAS